MSFIGRGHELKILGRLSKKKGAKLVVIRGRRRIGKSRLAEEFGKSFPQAYIFSGLAPEKGVNAKMQREDFAAQMASLLNIAKPSSDDWGDLFRTLAQLLEGKKVLLVLDEITWMGGKDPTFLGKLKTVWDLHFKKNPNLFIILSGSISSWIERNILSSSGFVGRISLDLILHPLPLHDCNQFWGARRDQISAYEKFKVLSVTGGIPRYLEEIDPALPAEENIRSLCFEASGFLFREFENIFSDLFINRSNIYQRIATALAEGPLMLGEICKKLNLEKTGVMSTYLDDLVTGGFICRDYTWSIKYEKVSKLSKYRLCDNYSRFFLKAIFPNKTRIQSGAFRMLPSWYTILVLQFENLVLTHRPSLWEKLSIDPMEIGVEGPYFQRKTKRQRGCQIDYLVQTRFGTLYLCEIKFSKDPISKKIIEEVQEKISRLKLPKQYSVRPVLIHVNGVHDSVLESEFFATILDFGSLLQATI